MKNTIKLDSSNINDSKRFELFTGITISDMNNIVDDYKQAQKRLFIKLRSYDAVKDKITDAPYIMIEDLVITFHIDLKANGAAAMVNSKLMERWNVKVEELYNAAIRNMEQDNPIVIMDLGDMFNQEQSTKMCMCTLGGLTGGSSCVLHPDFEKRARGAIGRDFYIIPSSTDEIIIVGKDAVDINELVKLIEQVNQSDMIQPDQILSYNVYELRNGKLSIAGHGRRLA